MRLLMTVLALFLAASATIPAADDDPYWLTPMKKVHAKFKGTPGTFAQFGDSITVTLAYWAGLQGNLKNVDPAGAKAHELVKSYMKDDCWRKWKGSAYGSQSGQTSQWAAQNVDAWLKKLNPEVALIMFGTNDLTRIKLDKYADNMRSVVRKCLENGTVVILSTIPPRHGQDAKVKMFNDVLKKLAQDEKAPLLDFHAAIVKRRPEDWDGALPKFKKVPGNTYDVPTLIARDGVHPSNPKAFRDFSKESLTMNGYALRGYLTLLAYADVINKVLKSKQGADASRFDERFLIRIGEPGVSAPGGASRFVDAASDHRSYSFPPGADAPGSPGLLKAVRFYASYDDSIEADVAGGAKTPNTRYNNSEKKGGFEFKEGFDEKIFRIAKGKGVHGGCLEPVDVLPRNGRIYYPAKDNLAFKKGGWGGALSVWINTDPNKLLKTKFCDPIQITHKGAHNGALWFDFNGNTPRDMRHGAFPALAEGAKPIKEDDPEAPLVWIKGVDFKQGDWHHIVISWKNLDSGKANAESSLYVDGKKIGTIGKRPLALEWDMDKVGIYFVINYLGKFDELALFDRPLTEEEIGRLHKNPGLLSSLKKKQGAASPRLREFADRLASKKNLPGLGKEMRAFLKTADGRENAEAALALLLRLPRAGQAPETPKFPFKTDQAKAYQQAYADWLGVPVEFTNRLGMTFVLIPPGTFQMGTPKEEPGHGSGGYDESLHPVTLSKPFYLSKHETTVGQWRRYIEDTKYVTDIEKAGGGNAHDAKAVWKHRPGTQWRKPGYAGPYKMTDEHPVVHVSVTDAGNFARWLSEQGSGSSGYELPTEAQWEWACRAGSADRFWWGPNEDKTGKVINSGDKTLKKVQPDWPRKIMPMDDGHAFAAPVGSYRANPFGVHDMLGNVWEFCSTRYGPYPKQATTDPQDLDPKRGYAVRGGGWSNIASDCRCGSRNADPPHFGHSNLGFRVALPLE